jgi:hypothetical protein
MSNTASVCVPHLAAAYMSTVCAMRRIQPRRGDGLVATGASRWNAVPLRSFKPPEGATDAREECRPSGALSIARDHKSTGLRRWQEDRRPSGAWD